MAKRKIVWTEKANIERKEILDYWIQRNKSKNYSIKLNNLIIDALKVLSENPTVCRKSDFEGVHVKIIRNYLLLYEFDEIQLKVLTVWDANRDGSTLEIK